MLTERARAEICRRVGRDGHSVASVARGFGVSWHAAMEAVRDHGRPRVDHLSRLCMPSAIGVDETAFLAAIASHPTLLVTGFVDLDRHRLIDVAACALTRSGLISATRRPVFMCGAAPHLARLSPCPPWANACFDGALRKVGAN